MTNEEEVEQLNAYAEDLEAENRAMRPVLDAALAYVDALSHFGSATAFGHRNSLYSAVAAYRDAQEQVVQPYPAPQLAGVNGAPVEAITAGDHALTLTREEARAVGNYTVGLEALIAARSPGGWVISPEAESGFAKLRRIAAGERTRSQDGGRE